MSEPNKLVRDMFIKKMNDWMLDNGVTQAELARRAGLLRGDINGYLKGRCLPNKVNAKKLAEVMGITVQDLIPTKMTHADVTPVKMYSVGDHMMLEVARVVPVATAVKILALLDEAKAIIEKKA